VFHCVYIPHLHSSVSGRLGCFHVLAVVNSAAVNIWVHVLFQGKFYPAFNTFVSIPRSRITRSCGNICVIF
uniref:Uncharacterized protein n=1 Tax=Sus scrofa TaxID=9823 RepID=A0A8W4FII1_PIG